MRGTDAVVSIGQGSRSARANFLNPNTACPASHWKTKLWNKTLRGRFETVIHYLRSGCSGFSCRIQFRHICFQRSSPALHDRGGPPFLRGNLAGRKRRTAVGRRATVVRSAPFWFWLSHPAEDSRLVAE